jgi:hypothetical protein
MPSAACARGRGLGRSTQALREHTQLTIEDVLMGGGKGGSSFLEPPASEPVNSPRKCQLRGVDQERDGVVGVPISNLCHGEVNEQTKPRMWRACHGKCLL